MRRGAVFARLVGVCGGRRRFFTDEQRRVLQEEKSFLGALERVVQEAGAGQHELKVVQAARQQLDELFLVVVVGEFNAGKVRTSVSPFTVVFLCLFASRICCLVSLKLFVCLFV